MKTADPRVRYVDSRHEYSIDGVVMPSVSQIIKPLAGLDRVPQNMLQVAQMRGTYVHKCIEWLIDGTLDESSVDAGLMPYVDAFRRFRDHHAFRPIAQECITTHVPLWYAGRIDLLAEMGGDLWLIDYKTSNGQHAHYGCQLAGYDFALRSNGVHVARRACLYLSQDGSWALREYNEDSHLRGFLACLGIRQWRAEHE